MLNIEIPIPPVNQLTGLEIYRQYAFDDVMSRIFAKTKEFYYKMYVETLKEGLSEQNWDYNSSNAYIAYYYKALFGFKRPYGRAIVVNKWDEANKKWDKQLKWDDTKSDGYMPIPLYRKLVKHIFSYKSNTFNPVWLWNFVRDFCDTTDFTFTFSSTGVVVNIKETKESALLSDIFASPLYNQSLPLTPVTFNLT